MQRSPSQTGAVYNWCCAQSCPRELVFVPSRNHDSKGKFDSKLTKQISISISLYTAIIWNMQWESCIILLVLCLLHLSWTNHFRHLSVPMWLWGKPSGFDPPPQRRTLPRFCAYQSPMPSVKTTNWPLGPWTPSWGRLGILEMMTSYDFHRVHSMFQQFLL